MLSRGVARGRQGENREEAALMLWWAQRQLRRGAWPALAGGAAMAVAILVLELAFNRTPITEVLTVAPLLPLFVLIPPAAWTLRRPRVQQSAMRNARLLAGRQFSQAPDPEEAERILARARKERWFRATSS